VELVLGSEGSTVGGSAATADAAGPIWPSLVALGVGGAALGVGAVTGAIAVTESMDVRSRCSGNRCPFEEEEQASSARTLANVSTASFVVGSAAVAAGAVLLFLRPGGTQGESDEAARVEPWLGPGLAGLQGRF